MLIIDGYRIDVALREDHDLPAEATDHPVERGGDITDHVRVRPVTITVEGIVSDYPVGQLADERGIREGGGRSVVLPSEEARAHLEGIRAERRLVTVETSKGAFDRMAMVGLSFPVAPGDGDHLRFTATFRQVEIVTNGRTTIIVAVPRAARKTKRGSKLATTGSVAAGGGTKVANRYKGVL